MLLYNILSLEYFSSCYSLLLEGLVFPLFSIQVENSRSIARRANLLSNRLVKIGSTQLINKKIDNTELDSNQ